ncbi:MAG TPA: metallophosphoesterase family protein [Ktedonobacteraceae bacterium]|nr:metallophosphoesterase family protein [Ktedonobacteraceae bacterium]
MRIAFLSDIHGNPVALDAVLADIEAQGGVDSYWILGDFSAMGYDPVGVLERVTQLPGVSFLRGNHDRYAVTGERPGPTLEQARANPQLVRLLYTMAANLAWTQGHILASGWWQWFEQLPLELRMTLPDGTRVLAVHSAPGTDDGPGIIPLMSDDDVRKLLAPAQADLVIVGHTHVPMDRTIDQVRVFNLGSISNPMRPRVEATYAILEAGEKGHTLQLRYVDYDRQRVIQELQRVKHPTADFLAKFIRGEMMPPWAPR